MKKARHSGPSIKLSNLITYACKLRVIRSFSYTLIPESFCYAP